MPLPNLIHPIEVEIEPADKANALYDRDAREPVRSVARAATIVLEAQVEYRDPGDPRWQAMGIHESVTGYLLFRVLDLEAAGYTPGPTGGDRIVRIGHRTASLFTLQRKDAGHYGSEDGSTLVLVYFGDRRPSATTALQ